MSAPRPRMYQVHRKVLRCTKCGHRMPIFRRNDRPKPAGHLKPLYCIRCRKRTLHRETH
jgi:ribosomal protein L33